MNITEEPNLNSQKNKSAVLNYFSLILDKIIQKPFLEAVFKENHRKEFMPDICQRAEI